MKALILAGGFGTRLRSIVSDRPKPMAIITGKPFLEHQIRNLKKQGLTDFVIAVHYMSGQIKSYFGNGRGIGVDIVYSDEDSPMGTAGAIKKASKYLGDEPFIVLNGDTYTDINVKKFIEFHKSGKSIASMSVSSVPNMVEYGAILIQGDKVNGFLEKGKTGPGIINNGVYIFDKKVLDLIEENKKTSLETDIFPKLIREQQLRAYLNEGCFIDIGKPETHEQFRRKIVTTMILEESASVQTAIKKISENGVDLLLIVNEDKKLKGILNNRMVTKFLIAEGDIHGSVTRAMVIPKETVNIHESEDKIKELFSSGVRHLPILDDENRVYDIRSYSEEIREESFLTFRGKSPLRISFSGGGEQMCQVFLRKKEEW